MVNSSKNGTRIEKPPRKRISVSMNQPEIDIFTERAYSLGFSGLQDYLVYLGRRDCEQHNVSVFTNGDLDLLEKLLQAHQDQNTEQFRDIFFKLTAKIRNT